MYFIPIEVGGYDALSNLGAPLGTRAHRAQIICPRGRLNAARGTLGYDALSNLSAPVGTRAHRAQVMCPLCFELLNVARGTLFSPIKPG